MATQQRTVVLYPSLGVGHSYPMVELGKLFLRHGMAVIIAVVDTPHSTTGLAAANPEITFQHLPTPPPPCDEDDDAAGRGRYSHPLMRAITTLRAANPALRDLLRALAPAAAVLVAGMFCTDALDVAAELGVPAYMLFTSALADLAVMLHHPRVFLSTPASYKDMPAAAVLRFPGVPPIRASDMATTVQDRESDVARARLRQWTHMLRARGFLVNSFDGLEARALQALRDGVCTPGQTTPPVYCIGPMVLPGNTGGNAERHPCLEWLDTQPKQSVVFLSFGSMGVFSAAQLREIACGLHNSGQRFLWVVRDPPELEGKSMELDLEELLPPGFLEMVRGKKKGFVVKNWAPQTDVLGHVGVGAFVTHCRWNSALEGVVSGVPMICWPLYAEQRMNKVHMVEEMKVGVAMEGYDKGIVKAEEVEAKVKLVMVSDEGKKLRERLVMAKKMAADALMEGGSSDVAFNEFLQDLDKTASIPRSIHATDSY